MVWMNSSMSLDDSLGAISMKAPIIDLCYCYTKTRVITKKTFVFIHIA